MMQTRVLISLAVILAALLSAGMVSAHKPGRAETCRFSPSATKQLCNSSHAAPSPQVQPAVTSADVDESQAAEDTQALAPSKRTVRTVGGVILRPNEYIAATFRFRPERIRIATGGTATWVYADQSNEPHTATIVNEAELFKSAEDLENFEQHCPTCVQASVAHFPDPNGPPIAVVDVGEPGLDQPGDSLLFFPGEQISAQVSAPAGTALYYLCLIHPWMQGKIPVGQGR